MGQISILELLLKVVHNDTQVHSLPPLAPPQHRRRWCVDTMVADASAVDIIREDFTEQQNPTTAPARLKHGPQALRLREDMAKS